MHYMNRQRLESLLAKNESTKLDFKERLSLKTEWEKKELAKDVSAIANSKGGRGYIVFGIQDKTKKIVGIEPVEYREEQIQQIISQRCDPPVTIRFDTVDYHGKTVGVLTIYKSSQRPHQILQNGSFYLRRGSTTDIARREEIASMLQDSGLLQYETIPLYNVDIDQLNTRILMKYLEKSGLKIEYDKFESLYPLLEGLGILSREEDGEIFYPTIGGLLVFGYRPQQFLTHTGIKVINGKDNKKHYFYGDITSMLDGVEEYLENIIIDPDYPLTELFEAIANAAVHRDYFSFGREIVVYISSDNIEISNPGALYNRYDVHELLNGNNPYRRNNWLYHRLLVLDEKKRFLKTGSGLRRIKNSFSQLGKVKFISNEKRNLFKVILPGGFKNLC